MNERKIQNEWYMRNAQRYEVLIPNTYPPNWYECDLLAVTKANFMYEFEIKLSISDFKADAKKGGKRWDFNDRNYVHDNKHERIVAGAKEAPSRFWYIMPEKLVCPLLVPDFAGIIWAIERKRSRGETSIMFKEVRKAPRMHKHKVDMAFMKRVTGNLYFRYWNERLNLESVLRNH